MRLSKGYYHNQVCHHLPDNNCMNIAGSEKTSDVAFDLKGGILLLLTLKCKYIIETKAKE